MAQGFKPLMVEREIAEEMANTLGRIGQEFVKRWKKAVRALEVYGNCPEEARDKVLRERNLHAALDEAERYRYFLIVQREALGLRNHAEVERRYPLPKVPGRPPAAGDPSSPRLAWPGAFSRGRRKKSAG